MTQKSSQKRIEILLDKEEIRALRLCYSEFLDTGQIDKLADVFTADARLTVTVGTMQGIEEIKTSLAQAYINFDTQKRKHFPFVHAITNHQISITGENSASGSCYLLDLVSDRAATEHPFLLIGRYLDEYVRINGEWRIASSKLDMIWPHESI